MGIGTAQFDSRLRRRRFARCEGTRSKRLSGDDGCRCSAHAGGGWTMDCGGFQARA
jgi:hypothetical protein